jgi:HK97 family phage portal protein
VKYHELGKADGGQRSGSTASRDIRAFVDDVFDYVAIAFRVPPQLLKGSVADTDTAVSDFLAFCINPLVEGFANEINRKLYKKAKYLERTYLKIDTSRIRSVSIRDVAGSLDILLRIGAYSVDDCLEALGMEPLNTDWSRARWMTKNYAPITESHGGGGE